MTDAAAPRTLNIDFVSDVVCPWCAVGLGGLERALERLKGEGIAADIRFQPFELNPGMAPEGENIVEHIGRKYGATPEQSAANRAMIAQRGAEAGFDLRMTDASRIWNTFDAHRLLCWAEAEGDPGQQHALKRALLEAYHGHARSPADTDVLLACVRQVGLDDQRAQQVLAGEEYADEVHDRERFFTRAGIHSVPAVIVNERHLIAGGQPPEVFERALRQIAAGTT